MRFSQIPCYFPSICSKYSVAHSVPKQQPRELSRCSDGLRAGLTEFVSQQGQQIFLYPTAMKPALEPTQTPNQLVPGAPSQGVKRPEPETDGSPISNVEVKDDVAIPPFSLIFSWRCA
jgi:nucleoid-associated protein YgaU